MLPLFQGRPKTRLFGGCFVGVMLALGGLSLYLKRALTPEEQIAVLVKQLRHPDGLGNRMHHALWEVLPNVVSDQMGLFTPVPPRLLQFHALDAFQRTAPKSRSVVDALIWALDDAQLAPKAVEALRAIGPFANEALPKLLATAEQPPPAGPNDYHVRNGLYLAMASIGPRDQRVFDLLFRITGRAGPDASMAYSALENCAPHLGEPSRELLIAAFEKNQSNYALMRVIGKIAPGSPATIAYHLWILRSGNPAGRAVMAYLLHDQPSGHPEIIAELHRLLADVLNDPSVEKDLRRTFGTMRMNLPVDLAVDFAAMRSVTVLHHCIGALAKAGPAAISAVPLLRDYMPRASGAARFEAALAIYRIAGDFTPCEAVFLEGLRADDEATRRLAINHLVAISDHRLAFPLLQSALENSDRKVRAPAVTALGKLGGRAAEALPKMEALLNDPIFAVRIDASNAIQEIRRASRNL